MAKRKSAAQIERQITKLERTLKMMEDETEPYDTSYGKQQASAAKSSAAKERRQRRKRNPLSVGLPRNKWVNARIRVTSGGKIQATVDENVLGNLLGKSKGKSKNKRKRNPTFSYRAIQRGTGTDASFGTLEASSEAEAKKIIKSILRSRKIQGLASRGAKYTIKMTRK